MPLALTARSLFTRFSHTWIRFMFAAFCFAAIGRASESAAQQLILRGAASHKEGDLNRAATFLEAALAELERNTGDPELVSIANTQLAFIRMDQGQPAEAESLLRKAFAICAKRGDQGLPARIVASGNLALALIDRGKYTEADSLTLPAVEEAAVTFGSKSKQYATLLCIRANIAMGRDQLPRAIKLLQRAIAMERKQPDAEELGRAYQNLAAAAAQAGKTKLALASLRRARDTWLSFLPADHPALIDEQNTLVCIYLRTHQYQKAYAVATSLLPRAEKILGPDHPRLAVILSNAGMIYEREMREAEAVAAFHRAYQINLHALGPMHPNTSRALLSYGRTIAKDGQPAQGTSLQRQATALLNALH